MKLLWNDKDGGPESHVYCYGVEIKSLLSVLLLRFDAGSREAYHSHAFNAISWIISGLLEEAIPTDAGTDHHCWLRPSWRPLFHGRQDVHKVYGRAKHSWALTFRGPWRKTWYDIYENGRVTYTHGRSIIDDERGTRA